MNKQPVRLAKVENDGYSFFNSMNYRVEAWFNRHALLCIFVLFALLVAAFVFLMFSIVGISAVESGAMRNFMNGGYI